MNKIEQNVREALQNGENFYTEEGIPFFTRDYAMVYAYNVLEYTVYEIASLTKLAISTVENYCRYKFKTLLNKAISFFEKKIKFFTTSQWSRISQKEAQLPEERIHFETSSHHAGYCTYIIEYYYDNARRKLAFTKIGKAKDIENRIHQHFTEYKSKYGKLYATVKRIFYFKREEWALTIENELRDFYKQNENSGYIAQDRFTNIKFNKEEIENNERLNGLFEYFFPPLEIA